MKNVMESVTPARDRDGAAKWAAWVLATATALAAGGVAAQAPASGSVGPVATRATADFSTCTPEWPKGSLKRGESGSVVLSFYIATEGRVLDSLLLKSSGFPELDAAALQGIRNCIFKPATVDGKPVASWQAMEYRWTLDNNDPQQALKLQRALAGARVGDPRQQYDAAQFYEDGTNVELNPRRALALYVAAAEHGNPDAELKMGDLYAAGRWLKGSDAEARLWYRKAAGHGSAAARYLLGTLLQAGRGGAADKAEAMRLYRMAAEQAYIPAQIKLAQACQAGDGVARDDAAARDWYTRAAAQGDAQAQYALGLIFDTGAGVPVDYASAAKWYQMAAQRDHVGAAGKLAVLIERGQGVDHSNVAALGLYQRAGEGGDRAAMARLIAVYEAGELGQGADPALANTWRNRLARVPEGTDLAKF